MPGTPASRFARLVFVALLLVAARLPAAPASDNAILYWNGQVLNATRLSRNPPPVAALHLATFHAALHDTVVGLTGSGRPWRVARAAPAGASLEAGVAAAARTVLSTLWKDAVSARVIEAAFDRAVGELPPGPSREAGLAHGEAVAREILALRADAVGRPNPDTAYSSTEPGRWRETPPGFRPAVLPQIASAQPFVLRSPDQFRAPPPPALASADYARELAEVVRLGSRDGAERTEEQTLSTPFWADDLGTATPAGHWNDIAQDLARRHGLSLADSARFFALLNFATADAAIACWDTKYHYRTWRPETAIRELTPALNPHHRPVPDFIPNMTSPAHPDYTSGHSTFSGAAARLLARFFGTDEIGFRTTSDGLPGAVREYRRLSDAAAEIGLSRIYGGIHTMSANTAGLEAGRRVADWVFENAFTPQP
jgi:hypothetical protein